MFVAAGFAMFLQVLDARDPAGCRCPDVERYVRSLDPNKRIILLLNKMGERDHQLPQLAAVEGSEHPNEIKRFIGISYPYQQCMKLYCARHVMFSAVCRLPSTNWHANSYNLLFLQMFLS